MTPSLRRPRWNVTARLALAALALTLLSCATASQLAKRSERARLANDPERAYALALQARAKNSTAPETRSALDEAAWALYERSRRAIRERAAAGDTFEAANQVIGLDQLRLRFAHDGVPAPEDRAFEPEEARIREAGADWYYDLAGRDLREGRPKDSWREYIKVRDLVRGYRDVDRRIARAWERAVTPVAILPFADEADMPGISTALAREVHTQLAGRMREPEFTFTRLVSPQEIEDRVSVAEAGRIDRARAITLGRSLGARLVVWGRVWNLRTDTDTDRWTDSVWRRTSEKDTSGRTVESWVAVPFHAVSRVRTVQVQTRFEVIDVERGAALDGGEDTWALGAHTGYVSRPLEGDPDGYRLVPPSLEQSDSERAHSVQEHWKRSFGPWTLAQCLRKSHDGSEQARYRAEMLAQFAPDQDGARVYLDDLPPAEDLASLAVREVWHPVYQALARLDAR